MANKESKHIFEVIREYDFRYGERTMTSETQTLEKFDSKDDAIVFAKRMEKKYGKGNSISIIERYTIETKSFVIHKDNYVFYDEWH